jgi:predicted RND superfamily exporter protein
MGWGRNIAPRGYSPALTLPPQILEGFDLLVIRLSRAAIDSPPWTLAAALLAVALAAPGLARLELRTDGRFLVPERDPAVVYDREVRERFGVRDPLVVVVHARHPGGVFNPETLRRVRDLTADLGNLPGIGPADLVSLATEQGFRFQPGTLRRSTFLEPVPATPASLAGLRSDLQRIGLCDGTLVSRDGRSTAILVGVPPEADRRELYETVHRLATRHAAPPDTVDVLGAPVAETLLGLHILADLGVPRAWIGAFSEGGESPWGPGLVPLAFTVMGLVFLAGFRRPAAALLPLLKVGACLTVVLGTMGWMGVPLYITTAVMPVILTASGIADEAHLFRRFSELRRARPDLGGAYLAGATLTDMTRPVVRTSLTTALGFFSFALSPLPPVRSFGVFTAGGILLCLLWSLTVTPAFLALLPPGWIAAESGAGGAMPGEVLFRRWAAWIVRHRRAVLAAAALVTLGSLAGVRRVVVQDSWVDGFAPASAFARSMRRFDEQFQGAHRLLVVVETDARRLTGSVDASAVGDRRLAVPVSAGEAMDPAALAGSALEIRSARAGSPGPWTSWVETASLEDGRLVLSWPVTGGSPKFLLQPPPGSRAGYEVRLQPLTVPATLRRIGGLESFLAEQPGVGGVLGPARFLATAGFLAAPDRPGSRKLPERPDEAQTLWRNSEVVRGPERLRLLVDGERSRGLITVFLRESNYAATRSLMAEIRDHERDHLAPNGIRLGFAGDVAVSQAMIRGVVSTQVGSLVLALGGIFVMTAFLGRSPRWGLYCVLPSTLAVLLSFAVMGWLGIPLGVATSMFAGMTLGIGVDYAIHLLSRLDRARADGLAGEAALSAALGSSGPAILIDTLAVGLGFATLLLSQVPANVRLGGLLALSLSVCMAATVTLVPALLTRRSGEARPIHNGACPGPPPPSGPG